MTNNPVKQRIKKRTWLARIVLSNALRLEMILCQWLLSVCCAVTFELGDLDTFPKLALDVLGA